MNWFHKLDKMKQTIQRWKHINFTLFGKVNFIKSQIVSKIVYAATCLDVPKDFVSSINKVLYEFIWGKTEKLKRKQIIKSLENGGLGMIDIESHFEAIKASWVSRIVNAGEDDIWSFIPKSVVNMYGENHLILKMNFNQEKIFPYLKACPNFYKQVIVAYNKSKIINEKDFLNTINEQLLWGNHFH